MAQAWATGSWAVGAWNTASWEGCAVAIPTPVNALLWGLPAGSKSRVYMQGSGTLPAIQVDGAFKVMAPSVQVRMSASVPVLKSAGSLGWDSAAFDRQRDEEAVLTGTLTRLLMADASLKDEEAVLFAVALLL